MILRRKPQSLDNFLDDAPQCREEETQQWSAINLPYNPIQGWAFRLDAVRFLFTPGQYSEQRRYQDFAVDVTWNDVLKIIGALAIVARHARYKMKGRPDGDNVLPTQQEEALLAAFTTLARELGITQPSA